MSNANRVGSFTQTSFSSVLLGSAIGVSTAETGNAIANIAILSGGLSNSGSTQTSGMAAVRRITVVNPNSDISTVSISVGSNSTGGSLVANAAALSALSAINTYQNLTPSLSANTTCLNGNVSSCLYVNQTANTVANGTYDIYIYGDVFKP
jgi:hypothetical protein